MFPSKNGISSDLIPATIILGSLNPYSNKLEIRFGSYAQVYAGTTSSTKQRITFGAYAQVYMGTTKSTKKRTVGEIALRTENERGGYYFMYPSTGKQIHAFIWTELPINNQVISRVNDLVTKDKNP